MFWVFLFLYLVLFLFLLRPALSLVLGPLSLEFFFSQWLQPQIFLEVMSCWKQPLAALHVEPQYFCD